MSDQSKMIEAEVEAAWQAFNAEPGSGMFDTETARFMVRYFLSRSVSPGVSVEDIMEVVEDWYWSIGEEDFAELRSRLQALLDKEAGKSGEGDPASPSASFAGRSAPSAEQTAETAPLSPPIAPPHKPEQP